jgi:hypothetical protein
MNMSDQPKKGPNIGLILGVVVLLALLIGGGLFFLTRPKGGTTSTGNPTPGVTQNAVSTPQPLFSDNFADNSKGWATGNNNGFSRNIINNALVLVEDNQNQILPEPLPTNSTFSDFTVTATVFDNLGASSVAVARVEAKSANAGLTILSPANSSSVNWPTPIVASTHSGHTVVRTNVLIDGTPAYATNLGAVNSALKVFVGAHQITVNSTDSTGAVSQSSVSVVGEPGDLPPTAAITVVPMPQISPNTVLACFTRSRDPDGFILSYKSQFSDGANFFTPAALHTVAAPGSYSVTLHIIDQFGAPASLTENFTVAPGGASTGAGSAASASAVSAARSEEEKRKQAQPPVDPIRKP